MSKAKKEKESMRSTEYHSRKINSYDFIEKLKRDVTKNPGVRRELNKIKSAVAKMQTGKSKKS